MTIYENLAVYLKSLPGIHDVHTMTLKLGRDEYPAAVYKQTLNIPEGSDAYRRGERQYTREMVMAIGKLPAHYCKSSRVAFVVNGDTREWYVAGYSGQIKYGKQAEQEVDQYHPFGNDFLLAPWDRTDQKIDSYEDTPYRRVPAAMLRKVCRVSARLS